MKASNKQTLLKAASESTADKINNGDQYSQAQFGLSMLLVSGIDWLVECQKCGRFFQRTIWKLGKLMIFLDALASLRPVLFSH